MNNICIETGVASLPKYGEELCGDNVETVRHDGSIVSVLADGLGSGVKANILSKMTAKIIATMVQNGAELEEVVSTIGNTLPICQKRKIAYSTFTIIQVEEDGEAYVVEYDNPSLIYLHNGVVKKTEFTETEICGKKIKESRFQVWPGDILVAVSDGVLHAGIGGVLNLGWQWNEVSDYVRRLSALENNADLLSKWLLTACEQLYAGRPGDDATVLALKVRETRSMTIAIGPPMDQADDRLMVRMFMEEPGTKVVCGGTTGSIIARALGREITVDLDKIDPEIPPTGKIRGVDLVTEGIITISKTLEQLTSGADPAEILKKKNAVASLSRLLLESDRVRFLVGRAINPAHQNPELPMSLGLKLQVVTEISEILKGLGKKVEMRYF